MIGGRCARRSALLHLRNRFCRDSYKAAEAYLKTLVDTENPFSTILADAQPVYIGKDLSGEYKGSEYTKAMDARLRTAKMQAATNLNEMLLLAENGEWRNNLGAKHSTDAQNGWYRYPTEFAVPVKKVGTEDIDHYSVFSGVLLIRNDADGKSYLYDMVDVQREKTAYASTPSQSGVLDARLSSTDTVAQPDAKSQEEKTERHSLTDTLVPEYPEVTDGLSFRDPTGEHIERLFDTENPKVYDTRAYHPDKRGGEKIPGAYLNKLTGIVHTRAGEAALVGYWQLGDGVLVTMSG